MMYLLKMFICSGILFGYYRFALYNERFHQWNRFYLLAAMLLSVVVPFLSIPVFAEEEPANIVVIIASMPWNTTVVSAPAQSALSWQDGLLLVLGIVSLIMFLKMIANIARLFITYKTNPVRSLNSSVQLVLTRLSHAPFSFFNWLFWRQDIDPASDNGQRMLTHELTHIREHHSVDKIFTEALLCMFWMNPFFWLMRRELGTIHEFLADRRAIGQQDGAAFAAMILHALQVQPSTTSGLVNPFFSSTIKRRLLMITTSKEPRYSYLRRLSGLVLMICSAIVLTLSIQQVKAQQKDKIAEKKQSAGQPKQDSLAKVRPTNIPIAKGGDVTTIEADTIIWKNGNGEAIGITSSGEKVKIEITKQQGMPDKVLLRLTPQGTGSGNKLEVRDVEIENIDITHLTAERSKTAPLYILDEKEISSKDFEAINPANIESITVLKDESAVAKYGERGRNGVINITLKNTLTKAPSVNTSHEAFRGNPAPQAGVEDKLLLFEGKPDPKYQSKIAKEVTVAGYANSKASTLVYKDGKQISWQEFGKIEPITVANINMLSGTRAVEKYGERARDGVIEIKTIPLFRVFTKAEQPAQFPGGEDAWKGYLAKNLQYPEAALKARTEGVARLQFIVDTEGSISNVRILSNPGNGIGEEAIRLIKKGPKWLPAVQNGREVNYEVQLSIDFRTNKYF